MCIHAYIHQWCNLPFLSTRASEILHFEIFSRLRENQLAQQSAGLPFCYSLFFFNENPLEAVVWKCSAKKVFLKFLKIYSKKPVPVACNFI